MSVNRCYSEKKPGFDVEARSLFSSLRDLFSFTLLIVLLLVKPSGLFGVDVQDKA